HRGDQLSYPAQGRLDAVVASKAVRQGAGADAVVAVPRGPARRHRAQGADRAAPDDRRRRRRAGGARHRAATVSKLQNRLVSQLPTTAEAHALLDAVRRQGVMDVVRGTAFVSVVLLAWVSLHPFTDLSNVLLVDLTNGNETLTYLLFGAFAVLMLGL